MIAIELKLEGDKEAIAKMEKLGIDLNDLEEEFQAVGKMLLEYWKGDVFETAGEAIGVSWAALKPSYASWKAAHGFSREILVRSGHMKNAFKYKASKDELVFGNTDEYSIYHDSGTSKMPKRQLYAVNDTLKRRITDIISKGLQAKVNKAFNGI